MIKDENFTIAENPEEAFWVKLREDAQKRIKENQHEIIINEAIVKLATEKSTEVKQNGE